MALKKAELRMLLAEEGRDPLTVVLALREAWQAALGVLGDHLDGCPTWGREDTARLQPVIAAGDTLADTLAATAGALDRRTQQHGEQMRVLTEIRQVCDAVAGVRREREEKRAPGAKGAVRVLIARYRALQVAHAAVLKEALQVAAYLETVSEPWAREQAGRLRAAVGEQETP
jgi:hypothetical protein